MDIEGLSRTCAQSDLEWGQDAVRRVPCLIGLGGMGELGWLGWLIQGWESEFLDNTSYLIPITGNQIIHKLIGG